MDTPDHLPPAYQADSMSLSEGWSRLKQSWKDYRKSGRELKAITHLAKAFDTIKYDVSPETLRAIPRVMEMIQEDMK